MKNVWANVVATVAAAAILANVTMLWQFSERLTKIETRLQIMLPEKSELFTGNASSRSQRGNSARITGE